MASVCQGDGIELPPREASRCVVTMEACAGAHYWAREIANLGHHVRLIAPAYVKPFIKGFQCG
jgi:transposase